jgi:hypothetical protein
VFSVTSKKKTAADDATVYIVVEAKPVEFIKDLRVRFFIAREPYMCSVADIGCVW